MPRIAPRTIDSTDDVGVLLDELDAAFGNDSGFLERLDERVDRIELEPVASFHEIESALLDAGSIHCDSERAYLDLASRCVRHVETRGVGR